MLIITGRRRIANEIVADVGSLEVAVTGMLRLEGDGKPAVWEDGA